MNEALILVLAGVAGAALGIVFFGGLWWSIRTGLACKRPELFFLGSLLLRTGVVVAGFYLIADGQWHRLVSCLLGFIIARFFVLRFSRRSFELQRAPAMDERHGP